MKKIVTIIGLLCVVLCVSAGPIHVTATVNYSSPYKGSLYRGGGYSSHSMHASSRANGVIALAPTATMHSTSSYCGSRAETAAVQTTLQVRGITTCASGITGGVTSTDTFTPKGAIRRSGTQLPPTGACGHCQWVNEGTEDDPHWVCAVCGCEPEDECETSCPHSGGDCHCDVPLDFNWSAMLFLSALAGAYAVYKARTREKEII